MKQKKIADDKVITSTPATFRDSWISGILSGKGQLSSQSMQLQAVVVFYNYKFGTVINYKQ